MSKSRTALLLVLLVAVLASAGWTAGAGARVAAAMVQADGQDLTIETDTDLPETFPGANYTIAFHARGGVPVLHWRVDKGTLPPGLKLEDGGLLHGQPERSGEFQFTVQVIDQGKPQQAVQKVFTLRVRSALTLNWKTPAHVSGSRIEGSAEVSNTTSDDMDLTFVVMAVAPNGRAVAIGYQHFVLRRGTVGMELPFGENLPHGGYLVHVDAVGEVAARNQIYRQQLETPGQLQVVVGP
jgi:Putative Ig domain